MGAVCMGSPSQTEAREGQFCSKRREALSTALAQVGRLAPSEDMNDHPDHSRSVIGRGGPMFNTACHSRNDSSGPSNHKGGILDDIWLPQVRDLNDIPSRLIKVESLFGIPPRLLKIGNSCGAPTPVPKIGNSAAASAQSVKMKHSCDVQLPESCSATSSQQASSKIARGSGCIHFCSSGEPRGGINRCERCCTAARIHRFNRYGGLGPVSHRSDSVNNRKAEIRNPLTLLALKESKARSCIIRKAFSRFGNIRKVFKRQLSGISTCGTEIHVFWLEGKVRKAICYQEKTERKLLEFWMNRTADYNCARNTRNSSWWRRMNETPLYWPHSRSVHGWVGKSVPITLPQRSSMCTSKENVCYCSCSCKHAELDSCISKRGSSYGNTSGSFVVDDDMYTEELDRKIYRQSSLIKEVLSYCLPSDTNQLHVSNCNNAKIRLPNVRPPRPAPGVPSLKDSHSPGELIYSKELGSPLRSLSSLMSKECNCAGRKRLISLLQE